MEIAQTTLIDFKTDPDFFYCHKLSAWIKRSKCVEYQDIARAVDSESCSWKIHAVAYARQLSCIDCQHGVEIYREIKGIQIFIKPKKPIIKDKSKKKMPIINNTRINWTDLMQAYNRQKKTDYQSVKTWLTQTYEQNRKSMSHLSRVLGVSPAPLFTEFRALGIPTRGRNTSGTALFLSIPEERMATMTKVDIARETGLGVSTVGSLLSLYKRRYVMMGTWRGKKRCG